jgi:hypothetical protein
LSCSKDPADFQIRLDKALSEYLTRTLGAYYASQYNIMVIDSLDINKVGLSEEMAKNYIAKSQAPVIIVMETQDKAASFTLVKDARQK